jgi:hypothetical protein
LDGCVFRWSFWLIVLFFSFYCQCWRMPARNMLKGGFRLLVVVHSNEVQPITIHLQSQHSHVCCIKPAQSEQWLSFYPCRKWHTRSVSALDGHIVTGRIKP